LLLHDLGGTPYEMRDIAREFAEDCYLSADLNKETAIRIAISTAHHGIDGALAVNDLYGNPWDLIEPSPDGASI
jgi:hypothetical protein